MAILLERSAYDRTGEALMTVIKGRSHFAICSIETIRAEASYFDHSAYCSSVELKIDTAPLISCNEDFIGGFVQIYKYDGA
jgi:hypothetical protein